MHEERPGSGGHAGYRVAPHARTSAPWLVLVHGQSQDGRVFDRQCEHFSGRFNLLLPDLPAHGLSVDLPGPYGPEEHADAISAAVAAAGARDAVFWGTHTGAGVGLSLAARDPERFRALVLEGPVLPESPPPSVSTAMAAVREALAAGGMGRARDTWWQQGPWFDHMRADPGPTRGIAHRALIDDFPGGTWKGSGGTPRAVVPVAPRLAALRCPVLILNGEHDVADFKPVAQQLAHRLATVQLATIAGAGGFPGWERPAAVNSAVDRFLSGIPIP